jgi:sirohydrochlorin cobaltochelatase
MPNAIERALKAALARGSCCVGEIAIWPSGGGGFVLSHRDDQERQGLQIFREAGAAMEIAKLDNSGNYRPLKTAPNLRHGWRLEVTTLEKLQCALDYFYPGRLAVFTAWKAERLKTTALRETLDRQSGMYRVAAKISDDQINNVVGDFCRSDGGCLRTILWKRDTSSAVASLRLPPAKFDPDHDQAQELGGPRSVPKDFGAATVIPLLCQEACNLLVAECRKIVKMEKEL